ncbi:MAG: LpqB family beta-propeller domain-containing protein [Chloroflexota bacterium]
MSAFGNRSRLSRRKHFAAGAALAGAAALVTCGPKSPMDGPAGLATGDAQGSGSNGSTADRHRTGAAANLAGRLLYVGDSDIWLWQQGNARRLTRDRVSRQPAWSPDGQQIAHVKIDVNSSELWVMDADGANSRQLTHNYSSERVRNNWAFRPVWWPDGTRLLYLTEETTHDLMLWQITLDGRTRRPFLTIPDMEGGIDMPSISPDGTRLAIVTYRGPGVRSQVWTYTLPNGPWRQLTEWPDGAYDPAWSPDGTRLAYTRRHDGRHDVWLMDADGANPQPVTESGAARAPCWSPDGRSLAFISAETGGFDLWVAPVPLPLPPLPAPTATAATAPAAGGARAGKAKLPAARQLTRGADLDAVSGLSWTTE